MLRLLPDRNRRRWEVGVIKSTDGNTDLVWPQVGLPKHRRSACRAEMHPDLSPLLSVADIDLGWSIGANMLPLEKGNNAEHRAGPPLTLATMAGAYGIGIAGHLDTQGTTGTMRGSRHNYPSVINRVEVPDHLSHSEDGRGSSCCPRSPTTLRAFRLRCGTLPRNQTAPSAPTVKWAHWPLLRPLIRGPCSDEIPLGDGALFIRFAGGETIALFVRFTTQSTTTDNRGSPR